MNELIVVVTQLATYGISAEMKDSATQEIWGGSEVSESFGLKIYKNSFNLAYEHGNWVLRLQGDGQLIDELKFNYLNAAIEKVIEHYK